MCFAYVFAAYLCCIGIDSVVYVDVDIEAVGEWGSGLGT